ncbi:MAG TPA: hypothetical protein VFJ58_18250, partial [Armatimonadota bacterium]|nr:hypothetical protein [Armatimonadota bacterium]
PAEERYSEIVTGEGRDAMLQAKRRLALIEEAARERCGGGVVFSCEQELKQRLASPSGTDVAGTKDAAMDLESGAQAALLQRSTETPTNERQTRLAPGHARIVFHRLSPGSPETCRRRYDGPLSHIRSRRGRYLQAPDEGRRLEDLKQKPGAAGADGGIHAPPVSAMI